MSHSRFVTVFSVCKVSLQSFDITPPKSFLSIIIIITLLLTLWIFTPEGVKNNNNVTALFNLHAPSMKLHFCLDFPQAVSCCVWCSRRASDNWMKQPQRYRCQHQRRSSVSDSQSSGHLLTHWNSCRVVAVVLWLTDWLIHSSIFIFIHHFW